MRHKKSVQTGENPDKIKGRKKALRQSDQKPGNKPTSTPEMQKFTFIPNAVLLAQGESVPQKLNKSILLTPIYIYPQILFQGG